jgi:phytoene dehydrogenase-like protein
MSEPDAVIVGSGPNGLAAALTLARAGLAVELFERADTLGGGCRTAALTLPGYAHDVCSAVHPLAAAAPFFAGIDIPLLTPRVACAHPLDDGRAAAVHGSVADTAAALGDDRRAYRRLLGPLAKRAATIVPSVLGPVRPWPLPPPAMALFGLYGAQPASVLAGTMHTEEGRALIAGCAAHSMRPLRAPLTGGFGLLMTILAHRVGWPVVDGGSAGLVAPLVSELEERGATLHRGHDVKSLGELPRARATLLDLTPRQLLALDDGRLPPRYRSALARYDYGPGIFKLDWALGGPVPWTAEVCRETVSVHVGGSYEEVARSESAVWAGRHTEHPFCIVVQPSVIDPRRAPAGHQTLWAYCHVPNGSTVDMTERIEAQIERFAPGFRDLILSRAAAFPADVEAHNPNYVGGDIGAGANTVRQTIFRPAFAWRSYRTPVAGLYLCSAATPPGGGVHGMCGMNAALTALADLHARGRPSAIPRIATNGAADQL